MRLTMIAATLVLAGTLGTQTASYTFFGGDSCSQSAPFGVAVANATGTTRLRTDLLERRGRRDR